MKTMMCAMVGVAGLAVSAGAQVNWETRIGFARTTSGALLTDNRLGLTATGTYTFIVRVGIFNLTGLGPLESNQGLSDWTARADATGLNAGETLGLTITNSRISPFTFGPATSFGGILGGGGTTITSIDAARDVSGGASAPWLWDTALSQPAPMPTAPMGTFAPAGINSYANVWRFTILVNSLVGPDIVVAFAGRAGPIIRWVVFGANPPDPPGEEQFGNVNFLGITPQPPLHDYSPVTLTLVRIPAPGGLAALGLAGVLALARRRCRDRPS